ncbi:hypothetical protein KRR38_28105 [Novosphingobium sp. G106]|uniref:hypothetical protein n=1 Tax=Novosphingobium sp. G106 TaxID=2849500 RepID=UPI001C2D227C|nr:hypothetical protein [Novosphingobium sp. G106]MBV1691442.1 hypothetical protein [Novosphingobium sp. G106]
MRKSAVFIAAVVSVGALSSCEKKSDDRLAERVENAADKRAEVLESSAAALESDAAALNARADKMRETGESRADAIDAADLNAKAMSSAQKDAIVANESPAVQ